MTSGDLMTDGFLGLAFFGGFLLVLVAGAAFFEQTPLGRRIADYWLRKIG